MTKAKDAAALRLAPLDTPTDLRANAVPEISGALNIVLADMFALYLKTKNFHWHMSGPHFRDYHLLLDEQSEQIFATTDDIAERVRKIVLVNRTRKAAEAVATDMRYGTPLGPKVDIVDGDYDALKGAGIVLITAGVKPAALRIATIHRAASSCSTRTPKSIAISCRG